MEPERGAGKMEIQAHEDEEDYIHGSLRLGAVERRKNRGEVGDERGKGSEMVVQRVELLP